MNGFRKMMLMEQERLRSIYARTEEALRDCPEGRIRVSASNGVTQYYYCTAEGKHNGVYLSKSNMKLIRQLVQKSYDEKVLKLTEKRIKQLARFLKEYQDDELEQLFIREHPCRRNLITPVELPWEQELKNWMETPYLRKEFREGTPVILTERGKRVRSKSEKLIADYLDRNEIPYKYEMPLFLSGYGTVYPDFTILSKKHRREVYWEHEGRMDDPEYAKNAVRKITTYEENGIALGSRLILTFETQDKVLNTKDIIRVVDRYIN